jgi:hypothetical protein
MKTAQLCTVKPQKKLGGIRVKMERAKGFEPSAKKSESFDSKALPNSGNPDYTLIRAQILGELGLELTQVAASWSKLPAALKAGILAIVQSSHYGQPRKETVSQGGGVSPSLSGGDERSEPESQIKFPHGGLPSVAESTSTAENNERQ